MKAVMYHYVRPYKGEMPFSRHLLTDNFSRQLDYFEKTFGFLPKDEFQESILSGTSKSGIILTFDDSLKDHIRYVLPELKQRNLWGIFYIPLGPYMNYKLLDVHRIHLLLGTYGDDVIASKLKTLVKDYMISNNNIVAFDTKTYTTQRDNTLTTNYVKQLLNYFVCDSYRELLINQLMGIFLPDAEQHLWDYYMTTSDLHQLKEEGMLLGSHSITHPVMSKLSESQQRDEIVTSFEALESLVGPTKFKTYCHPYGEPHSFNSCTKNVLEDESCLFSFSVEQRDINNHDLRHNRQSLPRYDCLYFPFGSSNLSSDTTLGSL
jgi:hypothetical protein